MDLYCTVARHGSCISGSTKPIYLETIMGIILNGWYPHNTRQIVKKAVQSVKMSLVDLRISALVYPAGFFRIFCEEFPLQDSVRPIHRLGFNVVFGMTVVSWSMCCRKVRDFDFLLFYALTVTVESAPIKRPLKSHRTWQNGLNSFLSNGLRINLLVS